MEIERKHFFPCHNGIITYGWPKSQRYFVKKSSKQLFLFENPSQIKQLNKEHEFKRKNAHEKPFSSNKENRSEAHVGSVQLTLQCIQQTPLPIRGQFKDRRARAGYIVAEGDGECLMIFKTACLASFVLMMLSKRQLDNGWSQGHIPCTIKQTKRSRQAFSWTFQRKTGLHQRQCSRSVQLRFIYKKPWKKSY